MAASAYVILTTYKALVRSLIDYASPVFITISNSDTKTLQAVHSEALTAVFNAPVWTKTENIRAQAQMTTVTATINYLVNCCQLCS